MVRNIIIIRLDELGDFILWLDSAKEYRNLFPNSKITLLVNQKWGKLAKILPYWDDVVGINPFKFRFNPFYRFKWIKILKSKEFEIAISPRFYTQKLLEPTIMSICGKQKIVYGGNYPKKGTFNKLIKPRQGVLHELIRNADFIRALGIKDFKASVPRLGANKNGNMKYVVVCPTAFRKQKEWGMSNFYGLISRIALKKQINTVVVSNQKVNFELPQRTINATGKTDILKLIDCIANAQLVIANDSGPIHLACALGVKSVCIGQGKHGNMFVPYPENLEGMKPLGIFRKNVKSITVAEVWDIVKEMI